MKEAFERIRFGLRPKLIISMFFVGMVPLLLAIVLFYVQGSRRLENVLGGNFKALAVESAAQVDFIVEEEVNKNLNAGRRGEITAAVTARSALLRRMGVAERQDWLGQMTLQWREQGQPPPDTAFDDLYPLLQGIWKEHTRSFESTQAIFITDNEGVLLSSINTYPEFVTPITSSVRQLLNQGRSYLSKLYFDEKLRAHVVHLIVPVLGETGVTGAFHRIFSAKDYFGPLLENVRFGETGHVMLMDARGIVIDCPILPTGHQVDDAAFVAAVTEEGTGWAAMPGDGHGSHDFSITGHAAVEGFNRSFADSDGARWFVLAWQASDESFAPMRGLVQSSYLAGTVAMVLIVGLGIYAANRIVRPIRKLSGAAAGIGRGHLDHEIPVTTRDEIGELGATFNAMVRDLRASRHSEQEYMRQLQRTLGELSASETRVRAIVENARDGIVTINETGQIETSNPVAEGIFGCAGSLPGKAIQTLIPDLFAADNNGSTLGMPAVSLKDVVAKTAGLETFGKKENGSMFPLEIAFGQMNIDGKNMYVGIFRDITERRQMNEQLRKLYRAIEQSPSSVLITNKDGTIEYVNPNFCETSGYTREEVIGKTPRILKSGHHNQMFYEKFWAKILSGKEWRGEFCNKKKNGDLYWELQSVSGLRDSSGEITNYVAVKIDDTERKRAEKKLRRFAMELQENLKVKEELIEELNTLREQLEISAKTDTLTKLPNRRDMLEKIEYEKHRFGRAKKPFAFILGDIDYFKKVNDNYGHDMGDYVLVEVADVLRQACRGQDVVCRWGGEEFLVLLPETDADGALLAAEKLRSCVESHRFFFNQIELKVTMSFGLGVFKDQNSDVDQCVKQADENLYEAKRAGRNQVVFRR